MAAAGAGAGVPRGATGPERRHFFIARAMPASAKPAATTVSKVRLVIFSCNASPREHEGERERERGRERGRGRRAGSVSSGARAGSSTRGSCAAFSCKCSFSAVSCSRIRSRILASLAAAPRRPALTFLGSFCRVTTAGGDSSVCAVVVDCELSSPDIVLLVWYLRLRRVSNTVLGRG